MSTQQQLDPPKFPLCYYSFTLLLHLCLLKCFDHPNSSDFLLKEVNRSTETGVDVDVLFDRKDKVTVYHTCCM